MVVQRTQLVRVTHNYKIDGKVDKTTHLVAIMSQELAREAVVDASQTKAARLHEMEAAALVAIISVVAGIAEVVVVETTSGRVSSKVDKINEVGEVVINPSRAREDGVVSEAEVVAMLAAEVIVMIICAKSLILTMLTLQRIHWTLQITTVEVTTRMVQLLPQNVAVKVAVVVTAVVTVEAGVVVANEVDAEVNVVVVIAAEAEEVRAIHITKEISPRKNKPDDHTFNARYDTKLKKFQEFM